MTNVTADGPTTATMAEAVVRTLYDRGCDSAETVVVCMRATSLALRQLHPGALQRLFAFTEGIRLIIHELETL